VNILGTSDRNNESITRRNLLKMSKRKREPEKLKDIAWKKLVKTSAQEFTRIDTAYYDELDEIENERLQELHSTAEYKAYMKQLVDINAKYKRKKANLRDDKVNESKEMNKETKQAVKLFAPKQTYRCCVRCNAIFEKHDRKGKCSFPGCSNLDKELCHDCGHWVYDCRYCKKSFCAAPYRPDHMDEPGPAPFFCKPLTTAEHLGGHESECLDKASKMCGFSCYIDEEFCPLSEKMCGKVFAEFKECDYCSRQGCDDCMTKCEGCDDKFCLDCVDKGSIKLWDGLCDKCPRVSDDSAESES